MKILSCVKNVSLILQKKVGVTKVKIVKIEIKKLTVPLINPYVLSKEYGIEVDSTILVVSVYTDNGIVGYGECDPWPLFTGDTADICAIVLRDMIGPKLIGKDPRNIQEIHYIMDRTIRNNHLAKSAIDMAAYDILGKSTKLPVHTLLGGKMRSEIDVMWSVGGSTPEECAEEVLKSKERGYKGCMIKIGGEDFKLDALRTIAVREAVGPNFPLNVDANQGWNVDTAIRYGKMVEYCNLMFFEQPVQSWDVEGMARIRKALTIPISADEGVTTIHDAKRLVAADAVDIFSIKVTKHGGIFPAKEICSFAKAHGIGIFFNSMLEEGITQAASLALGAVTSEIVPMGHAYFSVQRFGKDITSLHTQIRKDGVIEVSDLPGLGITLKEDIVREFLQESFVVQ